MTSEEVNKSLLKFKVDTLIYQQNLLRNVRSEMEDLTEDIKGKFEKLIERIKDVSDSEEE